MHFIISNDKNEYINLSYMNNTFKMWYKEKLWNEFTELYYDKMIGLESLFKLSNSKNLYNNINCNNKLEFDSIDFIYIFDDIKAIIKRNLSLQLNDWEKKKAFENKSIGLSTFNKTEILSSFTPETRLENIVNYSDIDEIELNNKTEFNDYLINLSGTAHINTRDNILKNRFKGANTEVGKNLINAEIKNQSKAK